MSNRDFLANYPPMTTEALDAVWEYYRRHPLEIDRDIWYQDIAGNVMPDRPVPTTVIIEAFDSDSTTTHSASLSSRL